MASYTFNIPDDLVDDLQTAINEKNAVENRNDVTAQEIIREYVLPPLRKIQRNKFRNKAAAVQSNYETTTDEKRSQIDAILGL